MDFTKELWDHLESFFRDSEELEKLKKMSEDPVYASRLKAVELGESLSEKYGYENGKNIADAISYFVVGEEALISKGKKLILISPFSSYKLLKKHCDLKEGDIPVVEGLANFWRFYVENRNKGYTLPLPLALRLVGSIGKDSDKSYYYQGFVYEISTPICESIEFSGMKVLNDLVNYHKRSGKITESKVDEIIRDAFGSFTSRTMEQIFKEQLFFLRKAGILKEENGVYAVNEKMLDSASVRLSPVEDHFRYHDSPTRYMKQTL